MMKSTSSTQTAEERFWDKFIDRLLKKGVNEKHLRWYVLRAEQYIKAFPDQRLAEHTVADVNRYLQAVGRIGRITGWQFIQNVDAIQNLFLTAGLVPAVNWDFWRASAQSLSSNHPTIAKETPIPPASGATFKDKRNAESFLDQVRRQYPQAIARFFW